MTTSDDTFRQLYEVAVATSGVLEPERLDQLAVERACHLTGADAACLFWWMPERELLIFQASHPSSARPAVRRRARGEGVVGAAFDTGTPQVQQEGIEAVMAVPLEAGGRLAGVLCVRREHRWEDRQLEALTLLAKLMAPALAAAREHADLEASQESFRAVFADAQDQLLALVREFSLHRTGGEAVSMSEHQALMELSSGDELSQTELGIRLRLEKSTVSRLAVQMESRGWLERNRDTADGRLVRLRLTPRGQSLAHDLAAYRTSRLQGLLRAVPEASRDSVVQALKIVVQALNHAADRDATATAG